MSRLAERLLELRGEEAQGVFAARLGLKQAVYCHYEKGRREPSLDTLIHMALVLHRTTDYLLGLSDIPHEHSVSITSGSVNSKGPASPNIIATGSITLNIGGRGPTPKQQRKRLEKIRKEFGSK